MSEILKYLTPILVVLIGFFINKRLNELKSESDFSSSVKGLQYKMEVDFYDKKIRFLLNPLLACIEFDNSIWNNLSMLSDRKDDPAVFSYNLSNEIEKNHLIKNLVNASLLTRENLHYVTLGSDLYKALIEFIRHVAIYESIRNSKEECNPIDVGFPFPEKLEELLKKEYVETVTYYNTLIKNPNLIKLSHCDSSI